MLGICVPDQLLYRCSLTYFYLLQKKNSTYQTNGILLTEDIVIEFLKYVGTFELSIENLFENPVLLDKMGKIFQVIKSHNGMLNFSFVADRNTRVKSSKST